MKKYEYTSCEASVQTLNTMGSDGWEAVGIYSDGFLLKREIDADAVETKRLNLELLRILNASQNKAGSKKPDYSNASIAKANELLTEAQRKEAIPSKETLYWFPPETSENLYPEFRNAQGVVKFSFPRDWQYHHALEDVETNWPNQFTFRADTGKTLPEIKGAKIVATWDDACKRFTWSEHNAFEGWQFSDKETSFDYAKTYLEAKFPGKFTFRLPS